MFKVAYLSEADKGWLLRLRSQNTNGAWYPNRNLTAYDWGKLNQLIRKGAIFTQMTSGVYSFEIQFFAHPVCRNQAPELLIIVPYSNLTPTLRIQGETEASEMVAQCLTHTKTNKATLNFYGIKQAEPSECCY